MDKKMILEKNVACRVRKIRDRYILIGGKKCFELNVLGKHIWDEIDGQKSVSDMINKFENEYDVTMDVLENDICCFLESLLLEGIIDVVN